MKLDRECSKKFISVVAASVLFVTSMGMTGCSKKETTNAITASDANYEDGKEADDFQSLIKTKYEMTKEGIKKLFPTINEEIVNNSALIILLNELAKEDENEKIKADVISNFKSKIDVDNMMGDFNSFLDTLEQYMIENEKIINTNTLVIDSDKEILSRIEEITANIINGNDEEKSKNFSLIYTLFVNEDAISYNDLIFEVRDLSYPSRALAQSYARTAAYFARYVITDEEYEKIDNRTNHQDSKAYIKTILEILDNQMEEKSETNIDELFNNQYELVKNLFNNKVNIEGKTVKNLVNYINLEYLNSDKVSTKDKNAILLGYEDEKVSNVLLAIDAITEYNIKNNNDIILFSDLLVDNYEETSTGKIDTVALDYIEFNCLMLLNKVNENSTSKEIFNSVYFQNIYKYFTKQNFSHKYSDDNIVNVNYQDVSDSAKFIANEIIIYTLNKLPKIFEYEGYEEKINNNLAETIQYIQNVVTGECEKVDTYEYVKSK